MAASSGEVEKIASLIIKYLRNDLSVKEAALINEWIDQSSDNRHLFEKLTDVNNIRESVRMVREMAPLRESAWKSIQDMIFFEDKTISSYEQNKDTPTDPPQIITDARIINRTLLDIVRNDLEYIHKMKSRQFEEFVAELFEKQGYNVKLTPQTRDGGKDLFILEDRTLGKFLYYLECKKLAPHRPVGVRMVRELYGTVMRDRATAGILVTSSYFSDPSKDFTEAISNQMSLIDYNKLCNIIKDI